MQMKYLDLIDEYQDEMIKTLQELISIKSVPSEALSGAPFGKGVQEAFEYMLRKGKEEGFHIENIDNYGGHIEFGENIGAGKEIMGILGHLDVVPEGKDWDFKPYGEELIDGKIYGRGAIDDKGPMVACFYAMKALKDTGVILNKKVRLILGLDEETEWTGMDYYLKKVEVPDFGFTPDCDFPVVRGEMGVLIFKVSKEIKKSSRYGGGVTIKSVVGGNAANVVADYASAIVKADSYTEIINKLLIFKKETGYDIQTKIIDETLEITANGISSHGARPESGLNAISILMKFLSQIIVNNEDISNFIDFYNSHIGFELNGDSLGCGLSDLESGNLILNVGMIKMEDNVVSITINIRYPVTMSSELIYNSMLPAINKYKLLITRMKQQEPIYFEKDDEFIVTLMDIYRKHTGDIESKSIVTGCTTYAKAVKNTVAFGATFPGEPQLAHQKNEYITVDNLIKLTKIFADTVFKLADGQLPK